MPLVEKDGTETRVSYYPNDKLAEMIARAWADSGYRDRLLNDTANEFKKSGIFVDNPVVVTESVFRAGSFAKDKYTVFVLPDAPSDGHFDRSVGDLMETARIKMAYMDAGI